MARLINFHEAKKQLAKLLERAYARLFPRKALPPRQPGSLKGTLGPGFFEPLPEEELRAWEKGE